MAFAYSNPAQPKRLWLRLLFVVVSIVMLSQGIYVPHHASALRPTNRSLRIGSVTPGAVTTHDFSFTYASTSTVGSLVFEYCTSPLVQLACDAPDGLDVSNVNLMQQSGETGFTIGTSTSNKITLTRTANATGTTPSRYVFSNATNPTGAPGTFYGRIFTHESTDASDAYTDFGAVANSTSQGVLLSTEVPPILYFCVGQIIPSTCESAEGNLVDLGRLRPGNESTGTSQMTATTNAEFGLAILVQGTTLMAGNQIIPALEVPTESAPGNAQFGINLRANTEPDIGEDPSGAGIANPTSAYNIPNKYVFKDGDVVATTPNATDTRKFTVSYIANVPPTQASGVYAATLTYICAATF